jgi:GST-like protein
MTDAAQPLLLYYWPTPNGHKITLFLEETGLPYETPSTSARASSSTPTSSASLPTTRCRPW